MTIASNRGSVFIPTSLSNCQLKSYKSTSSIHNTSNDKYQMESLIIPVKSQFGVEFRRFSLRVGAGQIAPSFEFFLQTIQDLHHLTEEQKKSTHLTYSQLDGTNLPLNNDDNLRKALDSQPKMFRIIVQNKGESLEEQFGYGTPNDVILKKKRKVSISAPQDFRRVSSIIDADVLPRELRRVQLCKFYNNKPLGFFIRDGYTDRSSVWGNSNGPNGIFISRLLPDGLAASTNLLHVDDEILEVNGIDVYGRSLDQVTDIMIANSANLILTVKPSIPFLHHPYIHHFPPPPPYSTPPYSTPPSRYHSPSSFYGASPSNQRYLSYHAISPYNTLPYHHHQAQQSPFRSNLHFFGRENIPEMEERSHIPLPMNAISFSRDSTWRLSDKLSKMSLKTPESKKKNRPLSMQVTPNIYNTQPYYAYAH